MKEGLNKAIEILNKEIEYAKENECNIAIAILERSKRLLNEELQYNLHKNNSNFKILEKQLNEKLSKVLNTKFKVKLKEDNFIYILYDNKKLINNTKLIEEVVNIATPLLTEYQLWNLAVVFNYDYDI